MIASLRGVVTGRRALGEAAFELVVDVNGVGYALVVAGNAAAMAQLGQESSFAVHTHVREAAITLYGFGSVDERTAFELLLGAHGVGPALALAILSIHDPAELAGAIARGDAAALTQVPGVGQKTAARLLLELRERFEQFDAGGAIGGGAARGGRPPAAAAEVQEALAQLGYAPDEVRQAVRSLPEEGSVEELLRTALRTLAPRR
ncbi:MAG: Holliday junction branch migration protein RuvA [Acidimicrobiales bacterium]|jgi:Holliday junction DNA helicase RuvA